MSDRRGGLARVGLFALMIFTTFGSMEIGSRFVLEAHLRLPFDNTDEYWEERFLRFHEAKRFVYHGLMMPSQDLGWVGSPSVKITSIKHEKGQRKRITINAQGFRGLHTIAHDPTRFNVLIVGDSFTFGDDLDDEFVWPHVLASSHRRLNVFNLGMTAYGIGQMYLTVKKNTSRFKPDLVVLAYVEGNLDRSVLKFRDFKKPMFVIENEELVLTNVPIGTPNEVYEEVQERRSYRSRSTAVSMFRDLSVWLTDERYSTNYKETLNARILDATLREAARVGAGFLLVYLPIPAEIWDPDYSTWGLDFGRQWASRQGDTVRFVNLREHFIGGVNLFIRSGHYQARESPVVALKVGNEILRTQEWRAFLDRTRRGAAYRGTGDGRRHPDGTNPAPDSGPGPSQSPHPPVR